MINRAAYFDYAKLSISFAMSALATCTFGMDDKLLKAWACEPALRYVHPPTMSFQKCSAEDQQQAKAVLFAQYGFDYSGADSRARSAAWMASAERFRQDEKILNAEKTRQRREAFAAHQQQQRAAQIDRENVVRSAAAEEEAHRKAVALEEEQKRKRAQDAKNAQVPTLILKHQRKLAGLGFTRSLLNAMLRLDVFGMGIYSEYRKLEAWLALALENSAIEDLAAVSSNDGRLKGVRLKLIGRPSTTLFFSHDGSDLFVTHAGDMQRIYEITTRAERSHVSMFLMQMAGDGL